MMGMSNNKIVMAGINYRKSNLAERETLQLNHQEILRAYEILKKEKYVNEAVIVITCNRIEFYLVVTPEVNLHNLIYRVFKKIKHYDIRQLLDRFYFQQSSTVVKHLFRVAGGLDSMIIGEDQILKQLKEAYSLACSVGTPGKLLHKLFHAAFRTGKRVRTETDINKGSVSVSGAALNILENLIQDFTGKSVVLIGVNDMTRIALRFFLGKQVQELHVANRTLAKAQALTTGTRAEAISLDSLFKLLDRYHIIFSCTSKDGYILDYSLYQKEFNLREDPPPICIDLGVPRDIDPRFRTEANLIVIDQDYIYSYVRQNAEKRLDSLVEAEAIITEETNLFMNWIVETQLSPIFEKVIASIENTRNQELNAVLERLNGNNSQKELEIFSKKLSNRISKLWIEQLREWIHSTPDDLNPGSKT